VEVRDALIRTSNFGAVTYRIEIYNRHAFTHSKTHNRRMREDVLLVKMKLKNSHVSLRHPHDCKKR
jgi:hypothetical protein